MGGVGQLKTSDAVSPTSSTLIVGSSLAVFVLLYTALGLADFWLMRRYARLDPPEVSRDSSEAAPVPAPGY